MTFYADIADFKENKRIEMIVHHVVDHKRTIGFIVEDAEKADRYMSKIKAKNELIREIYRGEGPVKGTILVKVSLAPN